MHGQQQRPGNDHADRIDAVGRVILESIRSRLPELRILDVTDLFFELRSVKSDVEIACLGRFSRLVDIGFEAHVTSWRPGISEREYYASIVREMDAAGAEPPTFLLLESCAPGVKWPAQDPIPTGREVAVGDYIVSETSPKWAGYQAQGLQCLTVGPTTPEIRSIAAYAAEIWHRCTDLLRPGNTLEQVVEAARPIIDRARQQHGSLADTLHLHVSYAGLGGPDPVGRTPTIVPNQAFMPEIGPMGGRLKGPPPPFRVNGGYLVVSTDGAPRHFCGTHPIEDRLLGLIAA